jgi:RNA polymerase sigma factor (sigma-70 family)
MRAKDVFSGEAILNGPATAEGSSERSQDVLLEELVRQHSRLVYRIAFAALRSHHDAEDATQEIFLRVLCYSHKLAGVQDHKSWLARIAWRVAVERSRKARRKREVTLDDPERPVPEITSCGSATDQAIAGSQVGAVVELLVAGLPEKLREPLVLSTVEEMSPRDVAAALEISEAAVRSRVFRARQILREKLRERLNGKRESAT